MIHIELQDILGPHTQPGGVKGKIRLLLGCYPDTQLKRCLHCFIGLQFFLVVQDGE
jgi:hypothetical protein